ncbi:restriction endonuclease subunit S [Candidatus Parcubacteria bacterium]|nr:MAG: restriction endonuclease subunit S [Candidatus Parcubacteria bacterium]
MNSQTFLENFCHIASAPDGVKRLREMILHLGITGRLVKTGLTGNVDLLLDEIVHVLPIEATKRNIRWKKHHGVFSFELKAELPQEWRLVKLNDFALINMGQSPDSEYVSSRPNEGLPFYQGKTDFGSLYPTPTKWCSMPKKVAVKDDILISVRAPVGPTNLSAEETCIGRGIAAISALNGVDKTYLIYVLRSIEKQIAGLGTGSTFVAIKQSDLQGLPIPVPPIEEQKRIVAKVDELMALCHKLEAQQQERERRFPVLSSALHARLAESPTPANLKAIFEETEIVSPNDLRRSILSLAVCGKLTKQKKCVTEETLTQLKNDKEALVGKKLIKRDKPVVDFAGLNDIKTPIPNEWKWCRLNDIASVVRGGSPRPAGDPRFYGGKIPFLKVADVTRSKGMMVDGYTSTIKEAGLKKTRLISTRTVLLTNSGATLGVPAICDFETTFNDGIAAFIYLNSAVLDEFLYLYLKSKSRWFIDIASRGQGQPNLNTDIIRATWFPLPPIDEQRQIAVNVWQLIAFVDKLEEQQNQNRKIAETYAQAAVAAITGSEIMEQEKMKAPKTELVTKLQVEKRPRLTDKSPLANIITKNKGELSAKTLWQQSGLKIDVFYQQLKTEMANGWIGEPEKAFMKEVKVD